MSKIVEHLGYEISQSSYNNHIMIVKDNKLIMHSAYKKPLDENGLKNELEKSLKFIEDVKLGKIKTVDKTEDK